MYRPSGESANSSGADVEIVTERSGLIDLENFKFDYDAYLFKSHSPLAESLAAAAHYRGAKLLNEYPATMMAGYHLPGQRMRAC